MENASFTKGPWVAEHRGSTMTIVFAGAVPGQRPSPAFIADGSPEERMANARLIAAAPDLYEALKGLVDDDDASVSLADQRARSDARMAAAKAAILKATGA